MDTFDVLIVYGVFGVLFGFQRCDFRSSDLFPRILNYFRLNSLVGQGANVKSMFSTMALLKLGSSSPLEISTLPESFFATFKKFVMKHDRVLK